MTHAHTPHTSPRFAQLLHERGSKVTPARLIVLDLLQKFEKPVSAEEIIRETKAQQFDQATIYRTLTRLKHLGLVQQIEWQQGHAHYELVGKHHHHAVCQQCHDVVDLELCDETLHARALQRSGFSRIDHHTLEFFGLCRKCQRKGVRKRTK